MLEARGCCVPPPSPPIMVIEISDQKPGITDIPIKPMETQIFPPSNIQNSPICSAKNPAGIWRTAEVPAKADRNMPISVIVMVLLQNTRLPN